MLQRPRRSKSSAWKRYKNRLTFDWLSKKLSKIFSLSKRLRYACNVHVDVRWTCDFLANRRRVRFRASHTATCHVRCIGALNPSVGIRARGNSVRANKRTAFINPRSHVGAFDSIRLFHTYRWTIRTSFSRLLVLFFFYLSAVFYTRVHRAAWDVAN